MENFTIGCDVCGFSMVSNQCRIACPNCGYLMDCSDHSLNLPEAKEYEESRGVSQENLERS